MVRLESLSLKNFRGVKEGGIEGFADVNVVVGRNNGGKSTIGEALIRMACGLSGIVKDPAHRNRLRVWMTARREDAEWSSDLLTRGSHPRRAEILAGFQGFDATLTIDFPDDPTQDGTITKVLRITNSALQADESNVKAFLNRMTAFRPVDAVDASIEQKLWKQLLADRHDKSLVEALNEIFGLEIEQLQLPPDGRLLLLLPKHGLPLDVHGDGPRSALRCLMVLSALRETMYIVEEPENNQHPGSLQRFARAMCKQAKEQEIQLLLTTHSMECLRAFLEAAQAATSTSAVFHLSLDDGRLQAKRMTADAVLTLEDTGIDVRMLDLYA